MADKAHDLVDVAHPEQVADPGLLPRLPAFMPVRKGRYGKPGYGAYLRRVAQ